MIDTIVLTLDENSFKIVEHDKFSPSTEGLYSSSRYYRLGGRITESYYNKKREEFRAKQEEVSGKIASLGFAGEEYYLTSEYLLQLANRAYDLFMSSEAEEKRQLIKLTLQNLKLEGKTIEFELVKPFDKVFACASSQTWLPE